MIDDIVYRRVAAGVLDELKKARRATSRTARAQIPPVLTSRTPRITTPRAERTAPIGGAVYGLPMVVLVIVVVACFAAGMWAATTWLPPLAEGPVGTLAYFVVCGLAGASLALVGIRAWDIIHALEIRPSGLAGEGQTDVVASGLEALLWEAGSLAALTLVAYLLAPKTPPAESN